jgi:hypothetical protein
LAPVNLLCRSADAQNPASKAGRKSELKSKWLLSLSDDMDGAALQVRADDDLEAAKRISPA